MANATVTGVKLLTLETSAGNAGAKFASCSTLVDNALMASKVSSNFVSMACKDFAAAAGTISIVEDGIGGNIPALSEYKEALLRMRVAIEGDIQSLIQALSRLGKYEGYSTEALASLHRLGSEHVEAAFAETMAHLGIKVPEFKADAAFAFTPFESQAIPNHEFSFMELAFPRNGEGASTEAVAAMCLVPFRRAAALLKDSVTFSTLAKDHLGAAAAAIREAQSGYEAAGDMLEGKAGSAEAAKKVLFELTMETSSEAVVLEKLGERVLEVQAVAARSILALREAAFGLILPAINPANAKTFLGNGRENGTSHEVPKVSSQDRITLNACIQRIEGGDMGAIGEYVSTVGLEEATDLITKIASHMAESVQEDVATHNIKALKTIALTYHSEDFGMHATTALQSLSQPGAVRSENVRRAAATAFVELSSPDNAGIIAPAGEGQ